MSNPEKSIKPVDARVNMYGCDSIAWFYREAAMLTVIVEVKRNGEYIGTATVSIPKRSLTKWVAPEVKK